LSWQLGTALELVSEIARTKSITLGLPDRAGHETSACA
jgi:hypothetical protein